MRLILHIWRQRNAAEKGRMVRYEVPNANEDMSFLEMLDVLNEALIEKGEEPVAFDHDCREGICGMCGFMINGVAHGPLRSTTICQLHMRHFRDGQELYLEPWRAQAFPVVRDLIVNRSAFDRLIAAGGFISVSTGSAPDGNAILVPKENADRAMDAAAHSRPLATRRDSRRRRLARYRSARKSFGCGFETGCDRRRSRRANAACPNRTPPPYRQ